MFDMHYDLLSVAYVAYLKKEMGALEEWCKSYRDDNVTGLMANLYFMSEEEMKEELHPDYWNGKVSVIEIFQKAVEIVETMLSDTKIIYSIEGCDYLEVEDLEILYSLGLRAILPVWNNQNKYASGNRSSQGLTDEGKRLLDEAISLGIAIDLSHTNEPSYFDIINYIKQHPEKEKAIVYASHSNARELRNSPRNLTEKEVFAMKEIGGTIGLLANRNFVVEPAYKETATTEEKEAKFLEHIHYMVEHLGEDSVGIATDDMTFCKDVDSEYGDLAIFPYEELQGRIRRLLRTQYSEETTDKILYKNAERIYDSLIKTETKKNDSFL